MNSFLPPNNLDTHFSDFAQMQKLELTWIGKGLEPKLEPRILLHDPEHSIGTHATDNMLIHGDNLLALKALEQDFSGKVKCIYIDPPYNTGNAFAHYDDGIEHSLWLNLMSQRLKILRNLLATDGVIFISISEDECHYLKVVMDEVFGRKNYCGSFIWEKKRKPSYLQSQMGIITEYILSYAKDKDFAPPFALGQLDSEETYPLYNAGNPRRNLTFPPQSITFLKHQDGFYPPQEFREDTSCVRLLNNLEVKNGKNNNQITIEGEWRYSQESVTEQLSFGDYYIVKSLKFRPRRVIAEKGGSIKKIHNLLSRAHFDMKTYEDATDESAALFEKPFGYPKPEMLIQTLLRCVTNPGDLVLDSFLGSGTTAAVAHKMGRRWIGIELGQHAYTHCYERLRKVVRGEDAGGITEATGWKGGGGFRFYTLAPSLLCKDKYGQWVIDERYNAAMLAAAMAKQEGFRYDPHETTYWKQGRSTEKDFIYTTTQFITVEALERLRGEMKDDESLLVCCRSYDSACKGKHPNITIKKIPLMLLGRCEFGKDDYSLNVETTIVNLPQDGDDEDLPEASTEASSTPTAPKKRGAKKASTDATTQNTFFE
ncbi:MAG: site-specific DNA-methyltransferase [Candidatus Kapaibacteriota bacterium]